MASLADAPLAEEAVLDAGAAFRSWRAVPGPERGELLRSAARLLDERVEVIATDLTREEGKTLGESRREVQLAARVFRYFAAQTLDADGETYPSHSVDVHLFARRHPIGVVGVITPWNFPIAIPAWKLAPAIAFGNTVVWKPAESVSLTASHLLTALIDAGLPAGVINMVVGKGSRIGSVLTGHQLIAAITFTGSNAVGDAIRVRAAALGKPVQLELGGKNPAVVLADADLDLASQEISRAAFTGTGQKCTATSRVIVERGILDEFTARLGERASTWRVGDPLEPGTEIGPLATADQFGTVNAFLDQARADGGVSVTGDHRVHDEASDGFFVRPTVLTDVHPHHPIARDEVFGPVAVVLPVDSYAEAMHLANDSPFGLAASLFTADLSKALRFADEIEAGVVQINRGTAGSELHVPFGGMKESSSGLREQGKVAREFFTTWKTTYVAY